jgi:hypothetical protein
VLVVVLRPRCFALLCGDSPATILFRRSDCWNIRFLEDEDEHEEDSSASAFRLKAAGPSRIASTWARSYPGKKRAKRRALPITDHQSPLTLSQILLATMPARSYVSVFTRMSWKRAQIHAEAMLENLGLGKGTKGRKDLRHKRLVFLDDGTNEYRTMCFTIAAKIVRRRGAEVENVSPGPGEVPHAKVVDLMRPQPPAQSQTEALQRRPPARAPKSQAAANNNKRRT